MHYFALFGFQGNLAVDILGVSHCKRVAASKILSIYYPMLWEQRPQVLESYRCAAEQICELLHSIGKNLFNSRHEILNMGANFTSGW